MELYISQLVLEVTRRCNMDCAHCMRGDAEPIDMSTTVIDRVLDSVQGHGIGSVTFTGGEPTLNVPAIRYMARQLRKRKIGLGNFYVVTNGMKESLPMVHALIDMYTYCDEQELCYLTVSNDKYHRAVPKPKLYPALKFFNEDGHGPKEDAYIIMEGRAADNGIGGRETPTESWELDIQDKYVVVNNTLHISANGNVMPGCDFSFDRIDNESVGNVLTESLHSILQRQVDIYKLKEAA